MKTANVFDHSSTVGWADSHAHLNHADFNGDIEEIADELKKQKFLILNVAYDLKSARRAIELANSYDHMKASAGVHPHDAQTFDDQSLKTLLSLAADKNVVAIGETGLDFFRNKSPKEIQKEVLIKHIEVSNQFKKPLIIHTREAFEEIVPVFEKHFDPKVGGLLHCFSQGAEEAKIGVELGFHISFAGNSTYKKAENLREAAAIVPPDRLLIETDCPYLAPQSKRGKRNEPLYMKETAKVLAGVRGVTVDDLARLTQSNYRQLFLREKSGEAELVYWIRESLYINVTRSCSNVCTFCSRIDSPFVQGHYLGVEKDPSAQEIIDAIGDSKPDELVFCGFGEPTMRLEVIKEVARFAKGKGMKLRLNTNGHGNLINNRDIVPELAPFIDTVSVSLNAADKESYNKVCQPAEPDKAYDSMIEFIKESKKSIPSVVATAVDLPETVDIKATRKLAGELGVDFRLRGYNMVG